MPENHTRLLARIKFRATERQRDQFRAEYDAIDALYLADQDVAWLDRLAAPGGPRPETGAVEPAPGSGEEILF
jgi:hypothetical protein